MIDNQGTSYRKKNYFEAGLIVAKITHLPTQEKARLNDSNRPSEGGESPPAWKIWQIPVHVASVNAVNSKHGSRWTSQQLIPKREGPESPAGHR